MEGDLRFAEANPALSRASADGRGRSFSEPPEGGLPSKSNRSEASMHGPARTASASSELPVSSDSEVGPPGHIVVSFLLHAATCIIVVPHSLAGL